MTHASFWTSRALPGRVLVLFIFCLMTLSCGKPGMPVPKDPSRNFTWKDIIAAPVNNCISFSGTIEGAYRNLEGVRLELAPVNGPEDCPGCPFVPKEILDFTRNEVGLNMETGEFGFSYCPGKAKAYRWRLAGVNSYNRLPHALTSVQLLLME